MSYLIAGFRGTPEGAVARFARSQAGILLELVGQVAELLGGAVGTGEPEPASGSEPASGPRPAARPDPGELHPDLLAAELGLSEATELPDDPVLARLLPDAYSGDPEAAGEFRRYTEQGLRSAKVAAARTVLETLPPSGGKVRLSDEEARAWLRALNDVRLALGVRLGVTDDFDQRAGEMPRDDPQFAHVVVYQWLTYLQESLVDALS